MGDRNRGKAESRTGSAPPGRAESALISNKKLRALYAGLLRCRDSGNFQGLNTSSESPSFRGHEAALVGTTIDLVRGDLICAQELGVAAQNGSSNGANGTGPAFTHPAIGTALAHKTRNNGKVAVVFCDEHDAEPLREAVHIAAVHALPMVFVQQANGSPGRRSAGARSTKAKRSLPGKTPWFPDITVDRDDVVAVYRVAAEAISRARLGRGPTLIECRPYRLNGKPANGNDWHTHDPIGNMEHYLRVKGLLDSK